MFFEDVHHRFQILRVDFVIRINKDDILSFCKPESAVSGSAGTGVFSDVYDYRVCLTDFLEEFETVVSGFFIVSDDDFEVLIGLGKEVIEGCFNEFSGVVCRDDDADETCG